MYVLKASADEFRSSIYLRAVPMHRAPSMTFDTRDAWRTVHWSAACYAAGRARRYMQARNPAWSVTVEWLGGES